MVREEDLIQKLSVIVTKERERQQKFGRPKARVISVNTNQNNKNPAENNSQGSVNSELKGLKKELKAEIATLRTMIVTVPSRDNLGSDDTGESSDRKIRALRCRKCQEKGTGRTCIYVSTVWCVGVTNTSRLCVNNGIRETPGDHKEGDGCDPIP